MELSTYFTSHRACSVTTLLRGPVRLRLQYNFAHLHLNLVGDTPSNSVAICLFCCYRYNSNDFACATRTGNMARVRSTASILGIVSAVNFVLCMLILLLLYHHGISYQRTVTPLQRILFLEASFQLCFNSRLENARPRK